jgi:hypothetical protein
MNYPLNTIGITMNAASKLGYHPAIILHLRKRQFHKKKS